jgi:hypothetical protein
MSSRRAGFQARSLPGWVGVKYQRFDFWRQERQTKQAGAGGSSPKKGATVQLLETVISEA